MGTLSNETPHRARAMMMLRDDYLALYDEVESDDTTGLFSWACMFDMPDIFSLKPADTRSYDVLFPGRKMRDGVTPEAIDASKVKAIYGKGDFLTIVSPPEAVRRATPAPYGAMVELGIRNEELGMGIEHIFASQKPVLINEGGMVFAGTYGYARKGQLALFVGEKIGLDGFVLARSGGDFGCSADLGKGKVTGRVVGRFGGEISVTLPSTEKVDRTRVKVTCDGKPVDATVNGNTTTFMFEIRQRDGMKEFKVEFL